MKRILVTGKNSYIGTAFTQYAEAHYPGEFRTDMVSMRDGTWRELDFSVYDTIFHVAGLAHADIGHATEEMQRNYYKVNTDLTLEAAAKAKAAGVRQFVFMSSMIVYGGREHVTEDTVPESANFYGDSKWKADCGVRELAEDSFQVAVLRPPMIYGKGSKGNYPLLAKMAKKLPVFPKVNNRRSMLYIENLCEFLCRIILEGRGGIFFPQNKETVSTAELVKEVAECTGHRIWVTSLLAPFVSVGKHVPGRIGDLCRKAFGSSWYEQGMSEMAWDYRVADLRESVRRTEGEGTESRRQDKPAGLKNGETLDVGNIPEGVNRKQGDIRNTEILNGADEKSAKGISGREAGDLVVAGHGGFQVSVGDSQPLVSITTVTRNSGKTLSRTIESVLNQTYDKIEYLIIDGLSGDNTLEIAESYREKFAAKGIAYTIVSEADNGMYDAINKGIRLSHGAVIGNINSDDWYEPQAVEKAVRFMEQTGCDYMYADLRMVKTDGTSFLKAAKLQKLATSRGWNHPTQFARRELHLEYPYKLESLHDDFDFFLKVRKSGFRIAVLNETLANFTMEGISHERNLSAAIARGKCRYRIYRNNGYSRWYLLECILIEGAKFVLHFV